MLADTRRLSADELEGRLPGSPGEQLAVSYLSEQFRAAGAEPGNPDGSWVQKVPLVSITPEKFTPLSVKVGGRTLSFKHDAEVVAFSQRVTGAIDLKDSELVFAGYGVQAPEYQWDDFKGLDVKGKTIVVLVNDPPVADAADPTKRDAKMFGGNAMTYYGRWTYKYEKAAELGAAGVFIVHETIPAGYDFGVVQGFGGERFDLITPGQEHGPRRDSGLAVARRRHGAAQSHGARLSEAEGAGDDPRLQAGAAQGDRVDVVLADDEDDRLAERRRQDHRKRPGAEERVRDLHRALGSSGQRAIPSTATTSTTAPATTRAAARCCSSWRARSRRSRPRRSARSCSWR